MTHFEADEEGEWHGDEDEEPAEDGEYPAANSDACVAIIGCFGASHPRTKKKWQKRKSNKSTTARLRYTIDYLLLPWA